ncbi:hypothetical protein D9M71_579910 [compost metagenome]
MHGDGAVEARQHVAILGGLEILVVDLRAGLAWAFDRIQHAAGGHADAEPDSSAGWAADEETNHPTNNAAGNCSCAHWIPSNRNAWVMRARQTSARRCSTTDPLCS